MPVNAEGFAALLHQQVVFVEKLGTCDVNAELFFDDVPVRVQHVGRHPVEAALTAPPLEPVIRRAERIAPVVDRATAYRFRVVEKNRVVDSGIETASSVEITHRVIFALREI